MASNIENVDKFRARSSLYSVASSRERRCPERGGGYVGMIPGAATDEHPLAFTSFSANRTCRCKHCTVERLAQRHHPGLVIGNDVRELNVALRRIDEIPFGVIDAGFLRLWWNVSETDWYS